MMFQLTKAMIAAAKTGDCFYPISAWGVELEDGRILK